MLCYFYGCCWWSASYSLEKNQGLSGGVTNFRDYARTCTSSMHINLQIESRVLGLCYSSRLIYWYSRLILGPSRLMSDSDSFFWVLLLIWIGFKFLSFSEVVLIGLLKFELN